jgi:SAM-dependent methyltransferase
MQLPVLQMNDIKHWDQIYISQSTIKVGWYKPHLNTSLSWTDELNLEPNEPIIDVGGGASTFVDDLLEKGHKDLTVLDLSRSAIQLTQDRLGNAFSAVTRLQGDVTEIELPFQHYCLWHDRAVFHFLIEPETQQKYKEAILRALKIGGYFIIGSFALDGPPKCSGLPVQRYNFQLLVETFGNKFELKRHQNEAHTTPWGVEQSYVYCLFQRTA